MKKKNILLGTLMLFCIAGNAEEGQKHIKVVSDIKFSGYIMSQYQYSGQDGAESNSFNIRMARVSLEGRVMKDLYWKTQLQLNGNTTTLGNSPRMVDAFMEWQRLSFLKVKIGQFKRPFTFENPMNPIDQGFMSYSQNISKLTGFSDRTGEHASNGRDIGLQLQGDFLKNRAGRSLIHYQIGVFNGQGTNMKDVDKRKDIIGGLWVMPVKGLRIGAFGWAGTYARKGTWKETEADGTETTKSGTRSVDRNRYAISAEYAADDWTIRSEYIHSQGYGFKTTYQDNNSSKDCTLNTAAGDKADGLYALLIAPVVKKKVHLKARYDFYRPRDNWGTAKTFYEVGADYCFKKYFKISAEYAYVNDRSLAKPNYSMFDVQFNVRF